MARVLMVDDDEREMQEVCSFLRKGGHEPVCVPDGREALARLPTLSADVVILDVLAPEAGGMEFLAALRNYYRSPFIPVILLTSLKDGNHIRRATHLGIKRIFLKGNYDPADLVACVNELSTPVAGIELSAIAARASLNG